MVADRYRLDEKIGEGGMGVVWKATHTVTKARVALKILNARLGAREDLRKRFLAEARAAAVVDHPNVIGVLDVFELHDHTPVMVQDLLTGETLARRLRREESLDLPTTATLMLPIVDAVAAAHEHGVVHRDLKPENVFLSIGKDGKTIPMVLDFGIAKLLDPDEGEIVTSTGTMLGTAGYMSPEQGFGEKGIDGRADVWALGVMLYECLAGLLPIDADNIGQYLKRVMSDAIMPLAELEPDLPKDVTDIVMRMLEIDRNERLDDLGELIDVLRKIPEVAIVIEQPVRSARTIATADTVPSRRQTDTTATVGASDGAGRRPGLWLAAAAIVGVAAYVGLTPTPLAMTKALGALPNPTVNVTAAASTTAAPVIPTATASTTSTPAASSTPAPLPKRPIPAPPPIVVKDDKPPPPPPADPAPVPKPPPPKGGLAEEPPF